MVSKCITAIASIALLVCDLSYFFDDSFMPDAWMLLSIPNIIITSIFAIYLLQVNRKRALFFIPQILLIAVEAYLFVGLFSEGINIGF